MQRNPSQTSDWSDLNAINDELPIHNKTEIINEQLNDDKAELENGKKVLITGRFLVGKDNKYELECEATVDGVPGMKTF